MQEGGVVNPDPLASDSLSQQTSSASPLLPTEGSTDSDTQDNPFNFSLLGEDFVNTLGLEIPSLEFPSLLSDFEYRDEEGRIDLDSAFGAYVSENRTIQAPIQTEEFESQDQVEAYNDYVDRYNQESAQLVKGFQENVQAPLSDAVEGYNASLSTFNSDNNALLQKVFRLATPGSVDQALRLKNQDGEYDLSKLVASDRENFSYKVPGIGVTDRGQLRADDLGEYSQYFEKVTDEDGKLGSALTAEGQRWMATVVDPEAMKLLEISKAKNKPRALELKAAIEAAGQPKSAYGAANLKKLKDEYETIKHHAEGGVEFTDEELNDARKTVWARLSRDKALESVALEYDEWKNLTVLPGTSEMGMDLKEMYQDYLGNMEVKIYKDLLNDPSAMLASNYFGEDGFKLFLDESETALGERNSRFKDVKLSWEAGLVDLKGSLDAVATDVATSRGTYIGVSGVPMTYGYDKTEDDVSKIESEYYEREIERRRKSSDIIDKQTKYATGARFVGTFGQAALVNEQTQLDDFLNIKSQAAIDTEFVDYILPAQRSLPLSAFAQASGIAVGLVNPTAGLATTMGIMQAATTSKTYYDTYLDDRFDDMTDRERRQYAIAFGAAESFGEGVDFLTMRMGASLLSKGVTGRALQDAFGRGVYSRFTYKGAGDVATRTWGGFAKDLTLGLAGSMGVNAAGEYVAEGTTGVLQYIMERRALDEPIDWSEATDIFMHDGRIGIYAGLTSGGAVSSVQLLSAATQATLFEERFNEKAQMLALNHYIGSGGMSGVENQRQAEQLRKLNKSLSEHSSGKKVLSPSQLQETRNEIGVLTERAAAENQRLTAEFESLREKGRFDVIAQLLELDNQQQFLDWALSFDKRQIALDNMGAARTADGKIAKGYGSRMDSMLAGITDKKKAEYKKQLSEIMLLKKVAKFNATLQAGFAPSQKAALGSQTESTPDGFVLVADENGEMVLNVVASELEGLPEGQAALLEEAAEYAAAAKGGARVVVHTSRQAFEAAVGKIEGDAAYLEASQEQRAEGVQDEMHLVLNEGADAVEFRTLMVHEMGHFRFRDAVNNEESRKKMAAELAELANKDENSFVGRLYRSVLQAYDDQSIEAQEKELINHFVQAVAQGATVIGGQAVKADMSDVTSGLEKWGLGGLFGTQKVSSLDAVKIAQEYAREVAAVTGNNGMFTTQDFEGLAKLKELENTNFSAQQEGSPEESVVAMESRSLADPKGFLNGVTIQYTQTFNDASPGGRGVPRQRRREITVKDYNHFRNFYAKITGNGSNKLNMGNMTFFKDGKTWQLPAPKPKTDRNGNVLSMEAPVIEGYNTRVIRQRTEVMQLKKQNLETLDAKNRVLMMEFKNSAARGLTNEQSFYPIELLEKQGVTPLSELSVQERIAATDHAIANVQALNRSDITNEQLRERGPWLSIPENQDIFNIAGGEYQTRADKIDILVDGAEEFGLKAWEMLPYGSLARDQRHKHFGLATSEDIESALRYLENAKEGVNLQGGERTAGEALESKDLPDVSLKAGRVPRRSMPAEEVAKVAENYMSPSVYEALREQYGSDFMRNVIITAHNLDRTKIGRVGFQMAIPEGGKLGFDSVGKVKGLLGGPAGPMRMKEEHGVNLLHSNTNIESSREIQKIAVSAAQKGYKGYALLLRVLSEENSFNNPLVMPILIDALVKFVEASPQGMTRTRKVLESFMGNTYSSEEIDIAAFIPSEMMENVQEGVEQYKHITSIFERYADYMLQDVLSTPGLSVKEGKLQIQEEGVVPLLRLMQNVSGEIGFGDRGAFVSKILQSQGGVSSVGFVSKQQFLDAINDPSFKNAKAGDTVAVSFADISFNEETGLPNSTVDSDVTRSMTGENTDKKRVAYKYGVTGSSGFKLIENFMPKNEQLPFTPRAKMTKKGSPENLGLNQGQLASRRLPGRIYVEGGDSWTASTPTPYGAVLQRQALRLQDKYSDVLLLQQDVEKFKGSKVPQSQDFEMAMDIFYGIVRKDLEDIEAMLERINNKRSQFDISSNDLSDFLYARHAAERNKFIAERSPGNESGSGMTNERAEELLEELDSAEMRILADLVYDVVTYTRKFMVEGGLETRAVVEEWENRFKYYVPLNGQAVDESDESTSHYPTGGAGLAIYGPSVRKAKGRESETGANVLGNAIMQATAVAQRARKDQAMLSLYRLIKTNPNNSVWSVHGPKNRIVSMGRKLNDQEASKKQDVVPLRINGEQHFIRFKDESHAQALKGMTTDKLDYVSSAMAKYTGFLRNSYTVYNPAFFLSNFARDFHSAVYNAASEIEREGGILEGYGLSVMQFNKSLMKTTMSSLGLLLKSSHGGNVSEEFLSYMEEWERSGGRTGWSYSDTLNKLVAELGDKTVDKSRTGEALAKLWGNSLGAVAGYVEGVNEAFENSIRLAAYIEARRAGMTQQRAAQLSKNITVNFNKSGTKTASINSYWLFFNAAIQGMSRFNRTFATQKAELDQNGEKRGPLGKLPSAVKMGLGMIMFEYSKTIINILVSAVEPDDELYYSKIPDYKKQRGSIFMLGSRDPLVVPLPYGMNLFNNVGMVLGEMTMGVRSPESAAAFLALSAHASFSPISFGQGDNIVATGASTLSPSILKPAVEVGFNSTYFGGKVFQEQYPFGTETPEYNLAFRSPEFVVDIARYLNEMSGGAENISGEVNENPDPYYYLLLSLTGGAGKFAADVTDLGYTGSQVVKNAINETTDSKGFLQALIDTEKPRIKRTEIPIVKILYGEASRFFDYDLFDKNVLEVKQFEAQAKAYQEGEDVRVEGLNFVGINELKEDLKQAQDMIDEIRSVKRQLRDSKEVDYIKKNNLLFDLGEEERKAIMYFNARYYDLRGKYVDPKPQGLIPTETVKQVLGIYE